MVQQVRDVGASLNIISDRKGEEYVYNDWLNEKINIEKSKIEQDKFEYSAYLVKGDTYYQISGIMPQKEFKKIVENLYLKTY